MFVSFSEWLVDLVAQLHQERCFMCEPPKTLNTKPRAGRICALATDVAIHLVMCNPHGVKVYMVSFKSPNELTKTSGNHGIFFNAIQVFDQNWGMAIFCRRQLLPRSIFMWTLKRTYHLVAGNWMEALLATSAVISSKSGSPSIFKSKPKETMVTSKILKYLIQTIIQYPSNIQKKRSSSVSHPKIKSWLPHGFCGFTMNLQWSPKGHLGTLDCKRRMDGGTPSSHPFIDGCSMK